MRLILVLVLLVGLIGVACDSNDETNPSPNSTPTMIEVVTTESDIPDVPEVTPLEITPYPETTVDIPIEILFSEEGPVSIELTAESLTITNNLTDIVYYYVFPVDLVGLIDWYPCENLEQCAEFSSIEANTNTQIGIEKSVANLILYWWQLVDQPDGTTTAGSVNEILIEIP